MGYIVKISRQVEKGLPKLPANVRHRLSVLVGYLEIDGPAGGVYFQNYSKLSDTEYHCHLTYHYVACWRFEKKTILIEVYYAGTHEKAPY